MNASPAFGEVGMGTVVSGDWAGSVQDLQWRPGFYHDGRP